MNLVTSRNNNDLSLRVISKADPLPTLIEKAQYNFDQILLYGGGNKGDTGNDGKQGYPGATGIGVKGDTGQRGSIIHYATSTVIDGSLVTDPDYLEHDTVIDPNGTYFEVTLNGLNQLVYTQEFNLGALSLAQFWSNQFVYQSTGANPITKWILHNGGGSGNEKNLVVARRSTDTLADDQSEFYRVMIGLDVYAAAINSSSLICNIPPDLTDQTSLTAVAQIGLKHRLNSASNPGANTFWMRYIEDIGNTRFLGILDNLSVKIYFVHNTSNSNDSYFAIKAPRFKLIRDADIDSIVDEPYSIDYYNNDSKVREKFQSYKLTTTADYANSIWDIEIKETNFKGSAKTQVRKNNASFDLGLVGTNQDGFIWIETNKTINLTGLKSSIFQVFRNTSNQEFEVKELIGAEHLQMVTFVNADSKPLRFYDGIGGIVNPSFSIILPNRRKFVEIGQGESISFTINKYSEFISGATDIICVCTGYGPSTDQIRNFTSTDIGNDFDNMIPKNGWVGKYIQTDINSGICLNGAQYDGGGQAGGNPDTYEIIEIIPFTNLGESTSATFACLQRAYNVNIDNSGQHYVQVRERKNYSLLGTTFTAWQKVVYAEIDNQFSALQTFNADINVNSSATFLTGDFNGKASFTQLLLKPVTITATNGVYNLSASASHLIIDASAFGVGNTCTVRLPTTGMEGRVLWVTSQFSNAISGDIKLFNFIGGLDVPVLNINAEGNAAAITSRAFFPFGNEESMMLFCSGGAWKLLWTTISSFGSRVNPGGANW